ncbi:MAG: winged helix-turn-helix transcriptional regulator [Clostridium sp.]|uniref:winged helix-turn-helix transcriptional regulator n=1 Tax=Clostridium TaxID=1485 RepID=UPI00215286F5|nr:helix-turn-helix domain-containing protein [Clostridium sp. LY3-2]MCR6514062.1 helix-turn-helix transcriptional regulator [Clostridium sp. LY3-2]
MINYKDKSYVCLLDLAMELIRGKWKAVILCHLDNGEKRFLELQRITPSISHKVLTEKLKELEEDDLIEKIDYLENPPRVEYLLTPKGKDLAKVLHSLEDWSKKYFSKIKE